ncbi:MAG: histidine phosphatase family protein [Ancrocorticia sp.]|jgi:probable phosphoglycerate mutase|nr:histidine phosphatase family protein [Ancrocorticia sp.]
MRIYLIRHGQTEMNATHTIDTDIPGALLTRTGLKQAESLPQRLDGVPIDALYVSPLTRTHQTAAPLAAARMLDPHERAEFREIEAGALEGRSDSAAYDEYYGTLSAWVDGRVDVRLGGGVNGAQTLDRFDSAIRELEKSGADAVAIVSHGAMLGLWSAVRGEGLSEECFRSHHLKNTEYAVFYGTLDQGYRPIAWAGLPVTPGGWA